ncbi:hypothetical protein B0T24DRAFT_665464 [Lasiosphaeria ovina]|uniref:Uncharacterized protein n=1 Tax=Lasiosphaeria ovina TaxID=92902 RepID=A0AAE0KGY4_9PEZI|nr:hypothetical protein B0T24DRAFT_665464 [Lasiosphaeria ovina]
MLGWWCTTTLGMAEFAQIEPDSSPSMDRVVELLDRFVKTVPGGAGAVGDQKAVLRGHDDDYDDNQPPDVAPAAAAAAIAAAIANIANTSASTPRGDGSPAAEDYVAGAFSFLHVVNHLPHRTYTSTDAFGDVVGSTFAPV